MNIRVLIGVILILVGVFWGNLNKVTPVPPDNTPNVSVLTIDKPSEVLINQLSDTAKSITNPEDKIRLCVFNKVFADRLINYEADAQQINDVYVLAAKEVFQDSIKGKYEKLAPATKGLMVSVLGEENHKIVESEKEKLHKAFMAFAWCLNN